MGSCIILPDACMMLWKKPEPVAASWKLKKKIRGLFEKDTDIEKKLYAAIREYNSFDRSKLSALFSASFKHFDQDDSVLKNNFYSDLNEIIAADGKIELAESKALEALKEIITLNSNKGVQ